MNKLIIIFIILFKIPACSTWDQEREFVDGEDLSNTQSSREYRSRLNSFLTYKDSMLAELPEPIMPVRFNYDGYINQDTLVDGFIQIRIEVNQNHVIYFRDSESIKYSLKAYDNRTSVVYIAERIKNNYLRVFGVSLNTGNQFELYSNYFIGSHNKMYEWCFSPDYKYLLKTGDIGEIYGWSIVNLKDGSEGMVKFDKYEEFITSPKWINNEKFQYTLTSIPFKKGHVYRKDYLFFYSLLQGKPLPGVELNGDYLYPTQYIMDVKGHLYSERMSQFKFRVDN